MPTVHLCVVQAEDDWWTGMQFLPIAGRPFFDPVNVYSSLEAAYASLLFYVRMRP